ncbi:hypothetical protein C8Q74DRAFT_289758 [Fomes fomentarius]|nr:hypothetical protein C8Q74DRAFT_289758 [Fomes fomentarius]
MGAGRKRTCTPCAMLPPSPPVYHCDGLDVHFRSLQDDILTIRRRRTSPIYVAGCSTACTIMGTVLAISIEPSRQPRRPFAQFAPSGISAPPRNTATRIPTSPSTIPASMSQKVGVLILLFIATCLVRPRINVFASVSLPSIGSPLFKIYHPPVHWTPEIRPWRKWVFHRLFLDIYCG